MMQVKLLENILHYCLSIIPLLLGAKLISKTQLSKFKHSDQKIYIMHRGNLPDMIDRVDQLIKSVKVNEDFKIIINHRKRNPQSKSMQCLVLSALVMKGLTLTDAKSKIHILESEAANTYSEAAAAIELVLGTVGINEKINLFSVTHSTAVLSVRQAHIDYCKGDFRIRHNIIFVAAGQQRKFKRWNFLERNVYSKHYLGPKAFLALLWRDHIGLSKKQLSYMYDELRAKTRLFLYSKHKDSCMVDKILQCFPINCSF